MVRADGRSPLGLAFGGTITVSGAPDGCQGYRLVATLPGSHPGSLGDRSFCAAHALRYPYIVGEMAGGITSTAMVVAAARAGVLGFFGSAGLSVAETGRAVEILSATLDPAGLSWGANLIHSPDEPALEEATVELFLRLGVRRVSASAFMGLTANVVRYACTGLARNPDGTIARPNHLFAKLSRPEVARHFLSPAPPAILQALVSRGQLTPEEARLAREVPLASAITVEADSGGHTDNRPLAVIFPAIQCLRNELASRHGYQDPVPIGAAGGIGTPSAVAAAFALGAAYVLTGSVNQAAQESGISEDCRRLLAEAGPADVAMAPSADMFELGAKVQVLKRGTMFAQRANLLHQLYQSYDCLEDIPTPIRAQLERDVFRAPLASIWAQTRSYWEQRDAAVARGGDVDPKQRMALVFRWYLGNASHWPRHGNAARRLDYQIWCGPALGAFNAWVAGSFLQAPESRTTAQIALNLLEGAAQVTRAQHLRSLGVDLPAAAFDFRPRPLDPA